jgi:hypothetical protein
VSALVPLSPALRDTAPFALAAAYLGKPLLRGSSDASAESVLAAPLSVALVLEKSSAWPDTLPAIATLKAAIYASLEQALKLPAVARPDCLDVVVDRFAFRLQAVVPKELHILQAAAWDAGEDTAGGEAVTAQLSALERRFNHLPLHHSRVVALSRRFTAYGPTVALLARWVAGQLFPTFDFATDVRGEMPVATAAQMFAPTTLEDELVDEIADAAEALPEGFEPVPRAFASWISHEALELLVAAVFVHPSGGRPPSTPLAALHAVLRLLASRSWEDGPIIVDLELGASEASVSPCAVSASDVSAVIDPETGELAPLDTARRGGMTFADVVSIATLSDEIVKIPGAPALRIATIDDLPGTRWTLPCNSACMHRLSTLAAVAAGAIDRARGNALLAAAPASPAGLRPSDALVALACTPPLNAAHAIVRLAPAAVPFGGAFEATPAAVRQTSSAMNPTLSDRDATVALELTSGAVGAASISAASNLRTSESLATRILIAPAVECLRQATLRFGHLATFSMDTVTGRTVAVQFHPHLVADVAGRIRLASSQGLLPAADCSTDAAIAERDFAALLKEIAACFEGCGALVLPLPALSRALSKRARSHLLAAFPDSEGADEGSSRKRNNRDTLSR